MKRCLILIPVLLALGAALGLRSQAQQEGQPQIPPVLQPLAAYVGEWGVNAVITPDARQEAVIRTQGNMVGEWILGGRYVQQASCSCTRTAPRWRARPS